MNIIGNICCPYCQLETRFLIEDEQSKIVSLLGDPIEASFVGHSTCDYCQAELTIHIIEKEGVISAFLNHEEYQRFQQGKITIQKAEKHAGLMFEKQKEMKQFQQNFTLDFTKQPFKKHRKIHLNNQTWSILAIYKKENIEKDPTIRLQIQTLDEFWYEVQCGKEKRWLIVQDDTENNAVLTQDMPVLKNNEKIFEITEKPEKTMLILERELGDHFFMRVYQMYAGVRVILESTSEYGKEVEFDGLADTFEEALKQIEELFAVNEDA